MSSTCAPAARRRSSASSNARAHLVVQQIAEVACAAPPAAARDRHRRRRRGAGVAEQRVIHERTRPSTRRGERSDVIERARQRHDAVGRHFAERRLQSDDAAGGGGNADRAAGVGADAWRAPCRRRRWPPIRRSSRQASASDRAGCAPDRMPSPRSSCRTRTRAGWSCRRRPRRPGADARSSARRAAATWPSRTRDAAVVGVPRMSSRSLIEIGTPCSGPRSWPAASSRSASRACRRASSAMTRMNAFSRGLSASIRRRHSSVTCADVTSRARSRRPNSSMVIMARGRGFGVGRPRCR